MELAKRTLTLGQLIAEHRQLAEGDSIFGPKPRAKSSDESRELIAQAFKDLQSYVTKRGVRFPTHEKGQALRMQAVAPISVVAYMTAMTESSTSIKRIAAVVASLAPMDEVIRADLEARSVIVRLLTIGVFHYGEHEELTLSAAVKRILAEGKPELLGVTRDTVEMMILAHRSGNARAAKESAASPSPELAGLMMSLGRAIAENHSHDGAGVRRSERLKAVIDAFDGLQAHCDSHEDSLFRRHSVLQDRRLLRLDTAAALCLLLWLNTETDRPVPFDTAVAILSDMESPDSKPQERFRASLTELMLKEIVVYDRTGGLSVGMAVRTLCPVTKGVRKESLVHDRR